MRKTLTALSLMAAAPALADSTTDAPSQLASTLFQGCWSCGAFNTLGAIGLGFADTVFSQTANGMTILIGLFFALWLLWFSAKLFLPFGSPGANHWNMGAAKLLKLIVVLAFLQTSSGFWNYVFVPILSTGLGIASQLATAADQYQTPYSKSDALPTNGGNSIDYCSQSPPPVNLTPPLSDNAQTALTALQQMNCPLSRMQSVFGKGIYIGVNMISSSSCQKGWLDGLLPSYKTLTYLISGIILIGFFLFGFLVFPLLLIDVLARVILVATISPLAIAATLFQPTAKIAERSISSLLRCGLTLMFGAAIAGISKALMAYAFTQMPPVSKGDLQTWTGLSKAMDAACNGGLTIDFTTASFYMLIGTSIISIFMMRRAAALASELTGVVGGTGAQAGVAMMAGKAAGVAGRSAQKVAQHVLKKYGDKARQVTGNSPDSGGSQSDRNQSGRVSGAAPD